MYNELRKDSEVMMSSEMLDIMRISGMGMPEIRLINIYCAMIRFTNLMTRDVAAPVDKIYDFLTGFGAGTIDDAYKAIEKLSELVVEYEGKPHKIFRKCRITINKKGQQILEMSAHDDVLCMFFHPAVVLLVTGKAEFIHNGEKITASVLERKPEKKHKTREA